MDKFGIFNLLNSLLNNFSSNSRQPNQQENTPPFERLPNSDSSGQFSNEKGLGKKSSNTPPPAPPLQNFMLSTITEHDKFVKRVQKNNLTK